MNTDINRIIWDSCTNLIGVCAFIDPKNNAIDATFDTPFGLKVKCHFEFDVIAEQEDENDD